MGSISAGSRKALYFGLRNIFLLPVALSSALCLGIQAHAAEPGECDNNSQSGTDCDSAPTGTVEAPGESQEPRVAPMHNLDWVPIDELDPEQRALVRPNCCGAYISPPLTYQGAETAPEKAPLKVSADSTEARGAVATLEGDVQVTQGYRQVRSDRATLDRQSRAATLEGNITFREPNFLLTGDRAGINLDSGELDVRNVNFVLHKAGVRGEAEKLSRSEDNRIYVDDVTYTSCEPGNDAWALHATSVDIDTAKSVATAKHVRLNVRDVPVLYLPWLRYPLSDNRATGLLFPSILTGNDNGLDYAQPVYLNLAPNYDATFTPRLVQERGSMAELEFRHLSRRTSTVVSGGYLWDDQGGSNNDPDFMGEDRWTGKLDHRGGFGESWSSLIDYTKVSDIDFFRDIDSVSLDVTSMSHLNQQVKAGYDTDHWELAVQGQQFQTIILNGEEQYRQLPRVDANGRYRFGESDLVLSLRQHFVIFDHTEDDVVGSGNPLTTDADNTTITGSRVRANYALTWDKEWLWGFFKPRVATKYVAYNLDSPLLNQTDTRPEALVPVTSLDTGLYFERETPMFEGFVHTLEPRLFYVNAGFEDQSAFPNFDTSELTFGYHQLFRDDRFSGGDRIGDTEQATLGVTSRLIDTRTGVEKVRFSIGQVYYMADRKVTLAPDEVSELTRTSSDIALELSGLIARHWRYQADLLTNEGEGKVNKGSMSLRYSNEDKIINLSYRYTRRENVLSGNQFVRADIDQADISLVLPIAQDWRILARYNHDLRTQQELDVLAGIEYSTCCWRISLVARRWIDRDDNYIIGSEDLQHNNGVFFQIQFRGLAGTGKRVDNILREGIYGYQPPEN